MNNVQRERMINMMGQTPQYNSESGYDDVVATVDFSLSEHPNPKKARRKNIKNAIKLLKPTKRSFFSPRRYWFGGKFAYNRPFQCAVDGTNCTNADYGDLFDEYFRDPYTAQVAPFRAWTGGISGKGRKLNSTLCPQHMMLYHKLMGWIEQEDAEADPGIFSKLAKRGVAFVPIKRHKDTTPEHPLITKWSPVFAEAQKDGISVVHYKNPMTGENDVTMLVFDMRLLKVTTPTGTKLNPTDAPKYDQVES